MDAERFDRLDEDLSIVASRRLALRDLGAALVASLHLVAPNSWLRDR